MIIERERRGRVEILTINRPEARNAVNADVAQGIEAALDDVEADDDLSAVVVTGRGPVFSAGADLKAVAAGRGLELMTKRGGFGGITQRAFPKPLIAAVNGPALAGGFTSCSAWIASACSRVISLPRILTRLCSLISSSSKSESLRHSPTPTWTNPSAHFSTQALGTATSFIRM